MLASIFFGIEVFLTLLLAVTSLWLGYVSLDDLIGDKVRGIIARRRNKNLPLNEVALQSKHDAIMAVINKHNSESKKALAMYQIRRLNRKMSKLGVTDRSIEIKR